MKSFVETDGQLEGGLLRVLKKWTRPRLQLSNWTGDAVNYGIQSLLKCVIVILTYGS